MQLLVASFRDFFIDALSLLWRWECGNPQSIRQFNSDRWRWHTDHPSSVCPLRLLKAHLALESDPDIRLILCWKRVEFDTMSRICETHNCCRFSWNAESVSCAEVAELADARGSGPRTRKGVGVRVPSSAPSCQVNIIKSIISITCKQENLPKSSQSVSLGDKTAFWHR